MAKIKKNPKTKKKMEAKTLTYEQAMKSDISKNMKSMIEWAAMMEEKIYSTPFTGMIHPISEDKKLRKTLNVASIPAGTRHKNWIYLLDRIAMSKQKQLQELQTYTFAPEQSYETSYHSFQYHQQFHPNTISISPEHYQDPLVYVPSPNELLTLSEPGIPLGKLIQSVTVNPPSSTWPQSLPPEQELPSDANEDDH
jgi:hypothetical protein